MLTVRMIPVGQTEIDYGNKMFAVMEIDNVLISLNFLINFP